MAEQTTIKKLPLIKEDVAGMRLRIQELEYQVNQYKTRLDELRKAKNNLIIKKTTEYVNTVLPGQGTGARERRPGEKPERPSVSDDPKLNEQYVQELEEVIENLTAELNESKNLTAALRMENEDLVGKIEDYKREIKQWEVMYKEWMSMMEDRVTNINRTHQILQKVLQPGEQPPGDAKTSNNNDEDSDIEEVERNPKQQQQQQKPVMPPNKK